MAVEDHRVNLLPPQLLTNREIVKANNLHKNGGQMDFSALPSTMPKSPVPLYQFAAVLDPIASGKTSMHKADSGLTYHQNIAPRKRSRDPAAEFNTLPVPQKNKFCFAESCLHDREILCQIHNHQSQIDGLIAQHTEKVRIELEEQRKRQSRMVLGTIQEAMMRKLKEKDEEIQKMGKLNLMLQQRVNSLCMENQIWKDLAQTNEATANSLRNNLEQVLAHVSDGCHAGGDAAMADLAADDAESSCGSNFGNGQAEAEDIREDMVVTTTAVGGGNAVNWDGRMCKKCGVRESIVLLLPCRHLCLCTKCGSTIHHCPVCHSGINASVHVNFSQEI